MKSSYTTQFNTPAGPVSWRADTPRQLMDAAHRAGVSGRISVHAEHDTNRSAAKRLRNRVGAELNRQIDALVADGQDFKSAYRQVMSDAKNVDLVRLYAGIGAP